MSRPINLEGKVFGRLKVLQKDPSSTKWPRWICKCECGAEKSILGGHLRMGKISSCGCLNNETRGMSQSKYVGEISGNFWDGVKRGASGIKGNRKRGAVPMTLTQQEAWDLFLEQNRKCFFTGEVLTFPKNGKDRTGTASLDRIDSLKGYEKGNVQWVHKDVNRMKNIFPQERFIEVCMLTAKNLASDH